jgi:hypothetical protein
VLGLPIGWRCYGHPPQPGEWGHRFDLTPRPPCARRRCYCGRCPTYEASFVTGTLDADFALQRERAVLSSTGCRTNGAEYRAAQQARDARRSAANPRE